MSYQYLVVPFQGQIKSGGSVGQVSAQLQAVINQHANQGWEFHTLNDVNIEVTPGCLSALFGAKNAYVSYDQVIFRKATGTPPSMPQAESVRCTKCGALTGASDRFCIACGNPSTTTTG